MINKKVIDSIYRLHSHFPKDIAELNIEKMKSTLAEYHKISEDEQYLMLNDLKDDSPFRRIPIKKIFGMEYFDKCVALVMPTCIIFFNKNDQGINIHIRLPKQSLLDRIKAFLGRE